MYDHFDRVVKNSPFLIDLKKLIVFTNSNIEIVFFGDFALFQLS